MTRTDRRTLVRQLAETGMSQRKIAARLRVSKDTVRRDLAALESQSGDGDAPPDAPVASDAPQVTLCDTPEGAPLGAPVARLPRRVAQPLDGVDLRQWPAVRRDLAVLAQTGRSPQALAHQAITALAHHYARALAAGDLEPGQPFIVRDMVLCPLPCPAARTAAAGDV